MCYIGITPCLISAPKGGAVEEINSDFMPQIGNDFFHQKEM